MLEDLSILIVTWNGDAFLGGCLDSLRESCGETPEIVVVDNANQPSTKELVARFPNCKYVPSDTNRGFAGGNNLGFLQCMRKYVVLLNNDTVVHEEPFSKLMIFLREHPDVGIVQGTLRLSSMNDVLDSCGTLMTSIGKLHLCHFLENVPDSELRPQRIFSAKGALMLFERSLVERTDGLLFHEHFFNNYEETDFCHRVGLLGKKIYFVPTPPVDHLYNATIKHLPRLEVRAHELANILFSLHSLLGVRGYVCLLPFFYAYRLLMLFRDVAVGSFDSVRVWRMALNIVWRNRKAFVATRRHVQKNRVVSDGELLGPVTYRPPKMYWFTMIKIWVKGKY